MALLTAGEQLSAADVITFEAFSLQSLQEMQGSEPISAAAEGVEGDEVGQKREGHVEIEGESHAPGSGGERSAIAGQRRGQAAPAELHLNTSYDIKTYHI